MLGSDRQATLTWPVIVVSRVLPATLVASGLSVPAALWSHLPKNRPGPLLFSILPALVGLVVLAPQIVRPVITQPERFEGPLNVAFIPGLLAAWLRTKFGPLPLGLFLLAEAAALTIGRCVQSTDSTRWQLPFATFAIGVGGAVLLSILSGLMLRRFG